MQIDADIARRVVQAVPKREQNVSGYVAAAVMMMFFNRAGQTFVVYTRRTRGLALHSGDMAFPGGKIDSGDASSFATAARETMEEIGVSEEMYEHLGGMGFFETFTSRFDAAAHVAWCHKPPAYAVNSREVAEVVEFPLRALHQQFRANLDFSNHQDLYYLNFHYQPPGRDTANLWGLTARITHHFLTGLHEHLQHQ